MRELIRRVGDEPRGRGREPDELCDVEGPVGVVLGPRLGEGGVELGVAAAAQDEAGGEAEYDEDCTVGSG